LEELRLIFVLLVVKALGACGLACLGIKPARAIARRAVRLVLAIFFNVPHLLKNFVQLLLAFIFNHRSFDYCDGTLLVDEI
jgi:hypothetical protein